MDAATHPTTAGDISARIDRLPAIPAVWRAILLLSFGMFFELYDLLFSAYIAPSLVKSGLLTQSTPGLFGTTGIASFIAALFSGLFVGTIGCGFLADRFGRRSVFTISLLWYTVANVMVALQNDAFGLNLWRFVSGIGLGVEMVTIGAYLSEMAPKHMRGKAFACSQAIGFCCVPTISALAYLLTDTKPLGLDGWRWVVLVGAAAAVLIGLLRFTLPESPRWLARHGRLSEADAILRRLEAEAERHVGRPLPPPGPPEPVSAVGTFADLWKPPTRARVILLSLFNVFQTIGFYGFQNWVPTLLISQGVDITKSLGYTMLIAIAAPMGPLIGFALGDKIERKWIICGSAALLLVCGLIFGGTREGAVIVAMGLMMQIAANGMSYSFHAYQQELFPTGIRARAAGFVYSWSRLSVIFSSFVIAYILKVAGAPGVFAFIAGAMAVVIFIIGVFGPRVSGVALEKISG